MKKKALALILVPHLFFNCATIPHTFRAVPEIKFKLDNFDFEDLHIIITKDNRDFSCDSSDVRKIRIEKGDGKIEADVEFRYFMLMDPLGGFNMCLENQNKKYLGFRLFHMGRADQTIELKCEIKEESRLIDKNLKFENHQNYQVCEVSEEGVKSRF